MAKWIRPRGSGWARLPPRVIVASAAPASMCAVPADRRYPLTAPQVTLSRPWSSSRLWQMVDVPARLPAPPANPPAPALGSGPCGPARAEANYRCAEAERLSQAAAIQAQRLREAKSMLARVQAQRDTDARVRDRRLLSDAKENARRAYRESFARARSDRSSGEVQDAAGEWL